MDNPYFGVTGVDYRLYLGKEEGEPLRIEVAPTGRNKILEWRGGETPAAISQFTATSGRSLLEIAVDWFAQDDAGNVWYFGEDVWNYEKGRVANTDGSWTAGVDGPPGMIMPGRPSIGQRFNPENIPGNVFETVDIKRMDASYKLSSGKRLNGVVELHETLSDGMEEFKLYARGYGNVYVEVPGAREVVDIVYALPNDAIEAPRPGELNAALKELRAIGLRGSGDVSLVRSSLAKLAGRGDPIPSVLMKLGRAQLDALGRALTRSEVAKSRMSALDLEQTMLDVARLYRGRGSVEFEVIDFYARRMLVAAQSGDRSTAGTAAALAHGVALRNVTDNPGQGNEGDRGRRLGRRWQHGCPGQSRIRAAGRSLDRTLRRISRAEAITRKHKFALKTLTAGGVPGIVNDDELGSWPRAVKLPGVPERCLKVKACVHHDRGDVVQYCRTGQQILVL